MADSKDMTDQAVKVLTGTGMVDPRVYNSGIKFQQSSAPTAGDLQYSTAYVQPESSGIVNLVNPGFKNLWADPLNKDTLTHELEHSLAYSSGAELGAKKNRGDVLVNNYASLVGSNDPVNKYKPLAQFISNASNRDIGQHLAKNYNYKPNYLGASGADKMLSARDYEELASDLGAAMKVGKKDVFADPFLQKHLFNNDPYLMESVRSTLNIEPRMDAKDPQRLTAFPENVTKYKEMIKNAKGGLIDKPLKGGHKTI